MRTMRKLGFDIAYLALLTKEQVKPLSRWECKFSRQQIKALQHLGLKTDTIDRNLLNGHTTTELIFSASSRYLDLYRRKYHRTPITKDQQTVKTEGFLFGYPGCCVHNFAEHGYTDNQFIGRGQEILFHWACPGCRATPELLPYYVKTRQECHQSFDTRRPTLFGLLRTTLPAAAFSVLLSYASVNSQAYDPHILNVIPDDQNGDFLNYSEEILLGTHYGHDTWELRHGPREANRFRVIIDSLSDTPCDTSCYASFWWTYSTQPCPICGEEIDKGYVTIYNPMRGNISIEIPFIALHFMDYGSFSWRDSQHTGRINIEQLKRVLAPYDTDHHALQAPNDADQDGLNDDYEQTFGTLLNNPDSNGSGMDDGAEMAEWLIEKIAPLPRRATSDNSPYVVYIPMDGIETCEFCGMDITMGMVEVKNPAQQEEISFSVMGLHHMAHGRFGNIDAVQLAQVLELIATWTPEQLYPKKYAPCLSNHPNPFNATTQIKFFLPKAGRVRLHVFNSSGQLIRTLLDKNIATGEYQICWDGCNDHGANVSSGIYFCRLEHAGMVKVTKMLLVK
jgi:hypothetical protein